MTTLWAPSSDAVEVAVHDLGGAGPNLLLSHATGFHGHCYRPVADALSTRAHNYCLDYRGHGLTRAPEDWQVDWEAYGDDALAAAHLIAPEGGLIGFGHSMGGACLLMAAARHRNLFEVIIAFEPIVFPPVDPSAEMPDNPLVAGARRRRSEFDSLEDAIANYSSKPPLNTLHPDALRAYVEHGFEQRDDGSITLRCRPEHEARTFETGAQHHVWEQLAQIETAVVIIAGQHAPHTPASIAAPIADALPNAEFIVMDHLDHFGPMTHPDEIADVIARSAGL